MKDKIVKKYFFFNIFFYKIFQMWVIYASVYQIISFLAKYLSMFFKNLYSDNEKVISLIYRSLDTNVKEFYYLGYTFINSKIKNTIQYIIH